MQQYIDLQKKILKEGIVKKDRTGTGTLSVFGAQMRFDLSLRFPLLTTKKVPLRAVAHELLWFLSGSTNNNDLVREDVHIWDQWQTADGDLGPIYGKQWRCWEAGVSADKLKEALADCGDDLEALKSRISRLANEARENSVDQIKYVIDTLRSKPHSRRILVSAWNVTDLPDEGLSPQENVLEGRQSLAACHALFQFNTTPISLTDRATMADWQGSKVSQGMAAELLLAESQNDHRAVEWIKAELEEHIDTEFNIPKYRLSCQLYQRSADVCLGVPFNVASYALLTHMIADQVGMAVGEFIWTGGDTHIYLNHLEGAKEQAARTPDEVGPQLRLRKGVASIDDYTVDDFEVVGYRPQPTIKFPVAI